MAKPIRLTKREWKVLEGKLRTEYPPSVLMIRGVMKLKLGFTVRQHRDYTDYDHKTNPGSYLSIFLDFYSEKKRTWFLLKYSDFINELNNEQ